MSLVCSVHVHKLHRRSAHKHTTSHIGCQKQTDVTWAREWRDHRRDVWFTNRLEYAESLLSVHSHIHSLLPVALKPNTVFRINHLIPKFTVITACSIDDWKSETSLSIILICLFLVNKCSLLSAENNLLLYLVYYLKRILYINCTLIEITF